jgi:hypothetical protein
VVSIQSLTACAAVDVTLERVRALVELGLPESLTLEYKSSYTSGLVKSVAAMANSYGGLILVGVVDARNTIADRVIGVSGETVTQIANGCHNQLEPPWQPEIIPIALPAEQDKFVLVVRVDRDRAPRPILIDGRAPIRLPGGNNTADRARLEQLFREAPHLAVRVRPTLPAPEMPRNNDGKPSADYIMRSGMQIPVDDNASWRQQSERVGDALASALNNSQLPQVLQTWCGELHIQDLNTFHRSGYNRARHTRLAWQAVTEAMVPIEVIAEVVLPTARGVPNSHLRFTLDVVPRIRRYLATRAEQNPPGAARPLTAVLSVGGLHRLLDAILATLTDQAVVQALADFAGVDPLVVPQPSNLDLHTGPTVTELLNVHGLDRIEGAGTSHGANLLAQPALDLHDASDRRQQVDDWLTEIAMDAGLTGMEELLGLYHQQITKESAPEA